MQVDGASRRCLAFEDNGVGMSYAQLRAAMQLAPRSEKDGMLSRHGVPQYLQT